MRHNVRYEYKSPGPGLHMSGVWPVVWLSQTEAADNFACSEPGQILLSLCLTPCTVALTITLYRWLDIYRSRRWDTSPGWTGPTWPTCSRSPPAPPPSQWGRRRRRRLPGSRSPGWSVPTLPAPPSHSWSRGGRPRSCWPAWPEAWVSPDSTGGRRLAPSPPPPSADTPGSGRPGSWTPPSQHRSWLEPTLLAVGGRRRRRRTWWSWRGLGPEPALISTWGHYLSSGNKVTSKINLRRIIIVDSTHLFRISFTKLLKSSFWGFQAFVTKACFVWPDYRRET